MTNFEVGDRVRIKHPSKQEPCTLGGYDPKSFYDMSIKTYKNLDNLFILSITEQEGCNYVAYPDKYYVIEKGNALYNAVPWFAFELEPYCIYYDIFNGKTYT